ncbi:MAG: NUDIX domain-containing protein [Planctomycetota bacterium]
MSDDPRLALRHCPHCGGASFVRRTPQRDDRARLVCEACGYVHYVGPLLAAGAILHDGERICLVRRAHDPGRGKWTFPGGYVDLDEEAAAAALRETEEETGLAARIEGLVGVYNSLGPRDRRVVIVVYGARAAGAGAPGTGVVEEVEEVRWFSPPELPWNALAFPSSARALRDFLSCFPAAAG